MATPDGTAPARRWAEPHATGTVGGVPTGRCESCGDVGVDVLPVRRLYVTPESRDTPHRVEQAGLETWCFVCRTHYPHQEPDADGELLDDPGPPSG